MGLLGELVIGSVIAYGALVSLPATITAIRDDNHHTEYHFSGQLGSQHVEYDERNRDQWAELSYQGRFSVKNPDNSGYEINDRNNNLRLDNGDTITIFNTDGSTAKFVVNISKPGIAKVVSELQPQMHDTLDSILSHNTLGLSERR